MKTLRKLFLCFFIMLCLASYCDRFAVHLVTSEKQQNEAMKSTEAVEEGEILRNDATFPKKYEKQVGNVTFDTTIRVSDGFDINNLYEAEAIPIKIDGNIAVDVFLGDKTTKIDEKTTFDDEDGTAFIYRYTVTDNNEIISATNRTLTYSTPFFENIYRAFHLEFNEHKYSKTDKFEFLQPEEAVQLVIERLHESGFEINDYDYTYYALDFETMREEENSMYSGDVEAGDKALVFKDEWTAEDNCYYIFMMQMFEGLPVYFGSDFSNEDSEENMPIQAVVSSKGIERLDVGLIVGLFEFIESDRPVHLGDFEEMVTVVGTKYNNLLTDTTYTITEAVLYQMPMKTKESEFIMKPIWLFRVKETGIDGTGQLIENWGITLVDAQTGQEVHP